MIAWNEEKTIDLALKSIAGFADEVIIIDTGSFDNTIAVAREWMEKLGLGGKVEKARVTYLADARLASFRLCRNEWVLLLDSNLVLSDALKEEILAHMNDHPTESLGITSLNLMGDYEHSFSDLAFHAPHRVLGKRSANWFLATDRLMLNMPQIDAENWAVNLSRVRPAWRSWYRGEPFGPKHYFPMGTRRGAKGHMHKGNRQWQWQKTKKYHSIREHVKATMGLTLKDVQRIAPAWYLKELQRAARPITELMRQGLPEVIVEELKSPRYKLIKNKNRIVGRWPQL